MDENKNFNEEEIVEATEEVAEVEATEEVVEEVPATEEVAAEEPVAKKKGSKAGAIIAVIVAIIVIAAAVVTSTMDFNKYNKLGYVDISGKTIGELATEQGISLEEFLATYSLPEDMPENTTEAAAYYSIPVGKIAEMYGMDLAAMKEQLKLGDDVVAETPWGVAEGEVLVVDYIGAENIDAFKEQYGFGDEVNDQTKWKEIRNIVDQVQKDARIASEEAAAAAAAEAEANATEEAPAEGEETPVEGEEAVEGEAQTAEEPVAEAETEE